MRNGARGGIRQEVHTTPLWPPQPNRHKSTLSFQPNCRVINENVVNFWRPGNASERGGSVPAGVLAQAAVLVRHGLVVLDLCCVKLDASAIVSPGGPNCIPSALQVNGSLPGPALNLLQARPECLRIAYEDC